MHGRVLVLGAFSLEQEDVGLNWVPLIVCSHSALIIMIILCIVIVCLTSAFLTTSYICLLTTKEKDYLVNFCIPSVKSILGISCVLNGRLRADG